MRSFRICATGLALMLSSFVTSAAYAQLSPSTYTSLGTLNATSGTLTINTDTLAMTGAATFTGVASAQANGPDVAVFDFGSINIASGVTVVITGSRPLALLSKGNATISTTLPNVVGGGSTGGFIEIPSKTLLLLSQAGQGPGSGGAAGVNSGGAGYGGTGGGAVGGAAYGNVFQTLQGGSGGGAALTSNTTTGASAMQGGDGGGAIEIVAAGNLTVGTVQANAGGIFSSILSGDDYSAGGGAGGGILLSGGTGLTFNASSTLFAEGSSGLAGGAGISSGGGGGQVALSGIASYTLGQALSGVTVNENGGNANGSSTTGTFGTAGVLMVDALSTVIPSGTSVTLNGSMITSISGSVTQNGATIDAYIRHSAVINSGGTVTLGMNNALQQLDISGNNITAVTDNGTFNLNGYNQTIDTLLGTSSTATLNIASGSTLTVGIDNSVAGSGGSSFAGQITGSGTLVKIGTGTLTLSGANTFSGNTTVSGGTLILANNQALQNSTVTLTGSNVLLGFSGITAPVFGALAGTSNQGFSGITSLTVGGNNSSTTYSGNLSGTLTGGLNKTGSDTWTLTGANTQSGPLNVQAGTLLAGSTGAISTNATVTISTGATLDLNGNNYTVTAGNPISVQGSLRLGGASLNVASGATATYNGGVVSNGSLVGSGTQTLTGGASLSSITTGASAKINQVGTASVSNFTNNGQFTNAAGQTLNWTDGANTSAGKLIVNGTVAATDFTSNGIITVNSGGVLNNTAANLTLGGGSQTTINLGGALTTSVGNTIELNGGLLVNNGTISGTTDVNFGSVAKGSGTYGVVNVSEGGVYSPGNSPGIVTASAVSFAADSGSSTAQLQIQLAGTTPGNQYDQLHVTGQLSLGGTLAVQLMNSFSPVLGNSFDILDWGSLVGQFNSLSLPGLGTGLAWNTERLYTSGVLSIIASNLLPGDFDRNSQLDAGDIVSLEQALANPQTYEAAHGNLTDTQLQQLGDINGDGVFNNADLQALLNLLLAGSGSSSPVPEPGSAVLLAFAGVGLFLIRRRVS